MKKPLKIIMIDNYDSFTYNLVNQFRQLEAEVVTYRNDTPISVLENEIDKSAAESIIVISPGPGNPDSAGNTLKVIEEFSGRIPILGICLGHQSIVQQRGGIIGQAKAIVHGKADQIKSADNPIAMQIFGNLPRSFQAARYHSLIAAEVPEELTVIASIQSDESEVMAVASESNKLLGFQFHPESILTTQGGLLLQNAIRWLLGNSEPVTEFTN